MTHSTKVPPAPATPLFRTAAVQNSCDPVFGSVLAAAPASFTISAVATILIAVALIAILVFGRYTQRETVSGFIAVTDGDIRVFPQAAGTVADVLVSEGDTVAAGAPLFSLLTSRNDRMSTQANSEIFDGIIAERSALQEQSSQQLQYFAGESEMLRQSLQKTDDRIGSLHRQRQLELHKLAIARRNVERALHMRKDGYLSELDHDALAVQALDTELAAEATRLRVTELEAARQDAKARLELLVFQQRTRLAEIAENSGRNDQRLAAIRAGLRQVVVAPATGQVSALHVQRGQTVLPETLALSLIPTSASFYAELLVPGDSIGMLQGHPRIDLRFDAYPFEKFGLYGATVEQIARSLLLPGDARLPVPLVEPVYRVRARLDQQHIAVDGGLRPLTAGLTFSADIRLSERTLLEWLMAPVIGARKRL